MPRTKTYRLSNYLHRTDLSSGAAGGRRRRTPAAERLEPRRLLSGSVFQVTSSLDETAGGSPEPGSLRAAIENANASPGSTIEFSGFTGSSPITVALALPVITAAGTTIDGTTAPAGRVTIQGEGANGNYSVLDVQSVGFAMKGLQIDNASTALTLDTGSSDAVITDNYIGGLGTTNYNTDGIVITAGSTGDTIGGSAAADHNVISGNSGEDPDDQGYFGAVVIDGTGTEGNLVEGNWIGLDTTGDGPAPNQVGVVVSEGASGNTVSGNIISGNNSLGIEYGYCVMAFSDGGNNSFTGNTFGLNATGTAAVPNDCANIVLFNSGSINTSITASADTFSNNLIEDNTITSGLDSADFVIWLYGPNNKATSNTIADNICGSAIIVASTAENNTISQNSIYGNLVTSGGSAALGIDLGGSGTPLANSPSGGTSNSGANGDQQYPTLTVADAGDGVNLNVGISLTSNPDTTYTVELFATTPGNVSSAGYGPGQTYIASVTVTTDDNGDGTSSTQIAKSLYAGDYITTTATNASSYNADFNPDAGATSEFSQNVAAPGVAIPTLSVANASAAVGDDASFVATLSQAVSGAVTASFTLTPGTASTADFASSGGTVTFPAGTTQETIMVGIFGDSTGADESFTLELTDISTNAEFPEGQTSTMATGTILASSVGTQPASITVGASAGTVAPGESVTLNATVTGNDQTPTGTVTFLDNGVALSNAVSIGSSSVASLATTDLAAGTNVITASYSGDSTYAPAVTVANLNVTVSSDSLATSISTLTASAQTLVVGQTYTLTDTITSASGTGPIATGSIILYEDGIEAGSYTLAADGQAVITRQIVAADAATQFSAVYSGDANYASSTSNLAAQTFLPASQLVPAIGRAVVPAAVVAGQKFGAKVTVTITNSGALERGLFKLIVFADTSPEGLDASPAALLTVNRRLSLKTDRAISVPLNIAKIPAAVPGGIYYLAVEAIDPQGDVNFATTSAAVNVAAPFVSLSPSIVSVKPLLLKPKQAGTLVIVLTNEGNVVASGLPGFQLLPLRTA